jgi:hypothetical protein
MEVQEMQPRAQFVQQPSNGGECKELPTLSAERPCACSFGHYCFYECIHTDDEDNFKINISSGEDVILCK